MIVIGFGHYSRTGKDSTANYMIECLDEYKSSIRVVKRSLAWKLKQVCFELYGWAGLMPPEHYETKEGEKDRDVRLPLLNNMTPVEVWVAFGTKAVRNNVYDRTWLDYLLKTDHGCDVLIIPDIRFPNEADAIREMGGLAIKVVRPGYGPPAGTSTNEIMAAVEAAEAGHRWLRKNAFVMKLRVCHHPVDCLRGQQHEA